LRGNVSPYYLVVGIVGANAVSALTRRAIIFGDPVRKLDGLVVTCEKCGRSGRYSVRRLWE
jgi:hypothetical protein